MFRKVNDFIVQWEEEVKSTVKLFDYINDEKINEKPLNYGRSIRDLTWHLTESLGMLNSTGIIINTPNNKDEAPADIKTIKNLYEIGANSIFENIKNWKDEDLEIEDDNYGEMWKRGFTLYALIMHQAHHRAQITVLMRQLGMKVPGIYGPSFEEWEQFKNQ